jgi:hypothetical protein
MAEVQEANGICHILKQPDAFNWMLKLRIMVMKYLLIMKAWLFDQRYHYFYGISAEPDMSCQSHNHCL